MARRKKELRLFDAGEIIAGRYRVLDTIGAGAVGTVLRVSDLELDREVFALKVLHPVLIADEAALGRFRNEVLISRQLSHPNIVRVYDFDGSTDGRLYYLPMECIQGPNLRQYLDVCKGRRLGCEDALRILHQLIQALIFAHEKHIIHRDIKPENILLSRQGEAKLSDFGVAYSLQASIGFTTTGEAIGTPAYMPPEAFRGEKPDVQSDIYSLGIVAYEMLAGAAPFESESYVGLAKRHLTEAPASTVLTEAKVPDWLVRVIQRCLAKDKAERFRTCRDLLEALRAHASDTIAQPRFQFSARTAMLYRGTWLSPRLLFAMRSIFWAAMCIAPIAIVHPQNYASRRLLLEHIFAVERAVGRDLPGLKSLFGYAEHAARDGKSLIQAIKADDPAVLRAVPPYEPGLLYADEDNNRLVHWAVKLRRLDRLDDLARQGVPLNELNKAGDRPLHLAVKALDVAIVGRLIALGADALLEDHEGDNALHLAARLGNDAVLAAIINTAPHAEYARHAAAGQTVASSLWRRNKDGDTALHLAAKGLHSGVLFLLLKAGADPNAADKLGRTPLMVLFDACPASRVKEADGLASLLSTYRADRDARDKNGRTVSDYAVAAGMEF